MLTEEQNKILHEIMDDFLKEKYENVIPEKRSDGTVSFRKVTNGDRIRALADEEIAEKFSFNQCPSFFGGNKNWTKECNQECDLGACMNCWLEWLREEVDA